MSEDLFGFIGLGNMGAPMARNASDRGCKLIVHDIAGTVDRALGWLYNSERRNR